MFGTGTACVISPVARLLYKDNIYEIKGSSEGPKTASRIYKELTDIQARNEILNLYFHVRVISSDSFVWFFWLNSSESVQRICRK